MKLKDLTGETFGFLTVIKRIEDYTKITKQCLLEIEEKSVNLLQEALII